jgi:hypothetical protein
MPKKQISVALLVTSLAILACTFLRSTKIAHAQSNTETVIATYQAKSGKEDELLKAMAKHWAMIHRLGMVLDQPHLVLRGKDDSGKTYFVEILTWDDAETPDHAPAEVRAIWKEMETLVESRLGHQGIEYPEVHVLRYPPAQ